MDYDRKHKRIGEVLGRLRPLNWPIRAIELENLERECEQMANAAKHEKQMFLADACARFHECTASGLEVCYNCEYYKFVMCKDMQ